MTRLERQDADPISNAVARSLRFQRADEFIAELRSEQESREKAAFIEWLCVAAAVLIIVGSALVAKFGWGT